MGQSHRAQLLVLEVAALSGRGGRELDVIRRALREGGAKGGECKDVGGRSAFMPRHRRKRHSFPVALDDLVAWAWPVDPAEVEGNNTLFGKVRLSRCRAWLVP